MPKSKWRDPYLWPDVDILQNKFGIKNQQELDSLETNYTTLRELELQESPMEGFFDLHHLRALHKQLFQDVYPFAGEIRTINISKNETFANAPDIGRLSNWLFNQLQKEKFLTGLQAPAFAERAALYFNAINAIHPFREGNGRTQRVFIKQLAERAGHTLDINAVSNKALMIEACIQGRKCADLDSIVAFDSTPPALLVDMFNKATNPAYVDIMKNARISLAKDFENPDLIPYRDGKAGLKVEGLVLAKNDTFTAQLHGLKWFAVHKNIDLKDSLQPDELALISYDEKGIANVKHMGKSLEFISPKIDSINQKRQVVEAVSMAIVADKINNPEVAQAIMTRIHAELDQRTKKGHVPTVSVYDKDEKLKIQEIDSRMPDAEPKPPDSERNR